MKLSGENIAFIESKIDEEYLIPAELILENNAYSDYRTKGSNEHYMTIEDKGFRLDTNIIMMGERVKGGHCPCTGFSKNGICSHIAATTLIIRKKLAEIVDQQAIIKESAKKAKRRSNIESLLSEISKTQLEEFILDFTKQNAYFKLYFQAYFYNHLSEEQINALLESVFPPLTKAYEKVSPARLSNFISLADTLHVHYKLLVLNQNYIDAFDLNFKLLQKSFYIKYNLKQFSERLLKYHTIFLANFIETTGLIEAPEYKELIYNRLTELLGSSYISANLKQERDLWILLLNQNDLRNELVTIANKNFSSDDISTGYFLKFIQLCVSEQSIQDSKIRHLNQQEIYRIIQIAVEFEEQSHAQDILWKCLYLKNLNLPVLKIVLLHLSRSFDAQLLDILIKYYVNYKDNAILDFIKFKSMDWRQDKASIHDTLELNSDHDGLLRFYLFDEDNDKASILMMELDTIGQLSKYDVRMAELSTDMLLTSYKSVVDKFLSEHFGLAAQNFVAEAYQRLERIGLPHVRRELEAYISKKYKDRSSLN